MRRTPLSRRTPLPARSAKADPHDGLALQPEDAGKSATHDRLTPCTACEGTGFVPVEVTGAAGLTWGEQQQALLLLRYWHEAYRGGLEPPPTVNLMTELLLAEHT